MNERLGRQLAFALELDKEKNVLRQTHLTGHGRRENDAEHAWHMALMAYLLREYANEPVDIARVMLMCLLHDVVEIDAGDTYAYDETAKESQAAREAAAAERIFGLLPEDQAGEFRALFAEFDAGESADARFARAMDNLQPLLLNDSNDGGDWKEHAVTARRNSSGLRMRYCSDTSPQGTFEARRKREETRSERRTVRRNSIQRQKAGARQKPRSRFLWVYSMTEPKYWYSSFCRFFKKS